MGLWPHCIYFVGTIAPTAPIFPAPLPNSIYDIFFSLKIGLLKISLRLNWDFMNTKFTDMTEIHTLALYLEVVACLSLSGVR